MNVLITGLMMIKEKDRFKTFFKEKYDIETFFPPVEQYLHEKELLSIVGEFDGWICGDDEITRRVLQKSLPRLKVISKWGTGIDSIDMNSAKELSIPVYNAPGAFADAVSEVAVGYILNLNRQISLIDKMVRYGSWPKIQSKGLASKTVGIIGYGAIGQSIAQKIKVFGCKIFFYDPHIKHDKSIASECDFNKLVSTSDIVCLACNSNSENHHLFNKSVFDQMKRDSYIINVGRGQLIDEQALISALMSKKISGAALDVFENEPLPLNSKLLDFDNIILGSHNANNQKEATENVHQITIKNLIETLESFKG